MSGRNSQHQFIGTPSYRLDFVTNQMAADNAQVEFTAYDAFLDLTSILDAVNNKIEGV